MMSLLHEWAVMKSMHNSRLPSVSQKKIDLWMSNKLWNQVKQYMSIPCVDVLVENSKGETLLGWRRIPPYRNVWALPGGRVGKGENLQGAAKRILAEYGLAARKLYLVGVFPMSFPSRSDFPVCVAAKHPVGQARSDGKEFSSFCWRKQLPEGLGANYRQMIVRWHKIKREPQVLRFAKL